MLGLNLITQLEQLIWHSAPMQESRGSNKLYLRALLAEKRPIEYKCRIVPCGERFGTVRNRVTESSSASRLSSPIEPPPVNAYFKYALQDSLHGMEGKVDTVCLRHRLHTYRKLTWYKKWSRIEVSLQHTLPLFSCTSIHSTIMQRLCNLSKQIKQQFVAPFNGQKGVHTGLSVTISHVLFSNNNFFSNNNRFRLLRNCKTVNSHVVL